MDSQSYSRLLSYIVCELTMPIKKHIYNFTVDDEASLNPQILSAAALKAKSQIQTACQLVSSNESKIQNRNRLMSGLKRKIEEVKFDNHEITQLCEGTEMDKTKLDNPGNIEIYEKNNTNQMSSLSDNDCEILSVTDEINDMVTQPEPKRFRYSTKDNKQTEAFVAEITDINSADPGRSRPNKCPEGTAAVDPTQLRENNKTESKETDLYSDPLLLCSDIDFKVMFRVSRSTFQILVEMFADEELEPIEDVPLYKKVLIVLWLLGNSGSYKDASQVFDVSEEAVTSCFFDICATLYNKSEHFIRWPSCDESEEIASRIEKNFGFPGVVGVLGCQFFTISIPKETLSRRDHFNGKRRMYCVSLQLVCDDEFLIRDISPGLPGGIRPAQVLRDSSLGELLTTRPTELIDPNKHILARSEFPQLTSMLTPYTKSSESLTKDEKEFNALHESVCLLVDQTFQMLKDRFRILKRLDPEVATMVLVTTCVLHNICIRNGDT